VTGSGLDEVERGERLGRREGLLFPEAERLVQKVEPGREARLGVSIAQIGDVGEQRDRVGVGRTAPDLGELGCRESDGRP